MRIEKECFTKEKSFSFSTNLFLERKALPKELYSFLAQVLSRRKKVFSKKKKCKEKLYQQFFYLR